MSNTVTIILGIGAAVVVFYIRSLILLAQKQKMASFRLQAYLTHWQNWVMENDLFGLYYQGVKWNDEIQEILNKGGAAKDIVKLEEEKKKIITEVKNKIEGNTEGIDNNEIIENLKKLPSVAIDSLLDDSKFSRQNLIDGKTFISDEEAAVLGVFVTQRSIELKMNLIEVIYTGTRVLVSAISEPEKFDVKDFSKEISGAVWKGLLISKNIDSLLREVRKISSLSVTNLTVKNIFNEF